MEISAIFGVLGLGAVVAIGYMLWRAWRGKFVQVDEIKYGLEPNEICNRPQFSSDRCFGRIREDHGEIYCGKCGKRVAED